MTKHDPNPKRDSLDENIDELLAQMAAGKVITDEGAVSVAEVEARKPKPAFTGTELLDDGEPKAEPVTPEPLAPDVAVGDSDDEAESLADGPEVAESGASDADSRRSGAGSSQDEPPSNPTLDAGAQEAGEAEATSAEIGEMPDADPRDVVESHQADGLGIIPEGSVNTAGSGADSVGPEAAVADASGGTEPPGAEAVAAPADKAGQAGSGEPVPELADQLDSLLSGVDAAGPQAEAEKELQVEALELETEEVSAPAAGKDTSGAIDSLNAELEAAAKKVESAEVVVDAPVNESEPVAESEPAAESGAQREPIAAETVHAEIPAAASTNAPAETPAAQPSEAPPVIEPKGPGALEKLRTRAADAAHAALLLASSPLKNTSRGVRDTIGWVGLWTAFLGVCVWFYVLVLHTPAPPYVPEAAIKVVEQSAEGGEHGGGHGEGSAKKPAAKKEEGHAKAAGGHEKPPAKPAAKPATKPAAKPAKKGGEHGAAEHH